MWCGTHCTVLERDEYTRFRSVRNGTRNWQHKVQHYTARWSSECNWQHKVQHCTARWSSECNWQHKVQHYTAFNSAANCSPYYSVGMSLFWLFSIGSDRIYTCQKHRHPNRSSGCQGEQSGRIDTVERTVSSR
jgi:hypothetical protein